MSCAVVQGTWGLEIVTVVLLQRAPCSWLCSHASVMLCIVLCILFGKVQWKQQQQQHIRQLRHLGVVVRLVIMPSTMHLKSGGCSLPVRLVPARRM